MHYNAYLSVDKKSDDFLLYCHAETLFRLAMTQGFHSGCLKHYSRFIPKSCGVTSPCRIYLYCLRLVALPAFGLNRL
ncbi:MAG: hypothetical protein IKH45_01035 [Neisseriaceae bacterium]|nr:hypothetical protein [Neisseriaceae bacterium]